MSRRFHNAKLLSAGAAAIGFAALGIPAAHAQEATAGPASFPDVPANHWAYQAVTDLAAKGYVKGYTDATFLGNRALTRYEFATVIDRILQTIDEIKNQPATPTTPQVTQDDLNKIQVLVDTFKTQLTDIQSNLTKAQTDIETLRGQIADLRQDVQDTKDLATKAQATADNSYGFGGKRKFQISGYIQARYYSVSKNDQKEFPDGTAAVTSPYNGNYAKGGAGASFLVRRSRIKFTGQLTKNTKYALQLDAGGANNTVTAKEGNFTYAFGDGSAKNPAITAGLFSTPFGYIIPLATSSHISPERPLAFSEGASSGSPFANLDYERGVMASYGPGNVKLTAAFLNGTGLSNGTDNDRKVDQIYRVAYQSSDKVIGVGGSYYNGQVTKTGSSPLQSAEKQLWGADAQFISPAGPFLTGEYVDGKFPVRTYFNDASLGTVKTDFVDGNKIRGYYVQGGYTWGFKGVHPFTVAASWDVFDRSTNDSVDSDAYRDENLGYGVLYNLDAQTRLKLWYTDPNKVAHSSSVGNPDKVGLITSELQVKF